MMADDNVIRRLTDMESSLVTSDYMNRVNSTYFSKDWGDYVVSSYSIDWANSVVRSDLIHQAWSAIKKQREIDPYAESSLYNIIQEANPTIIAFGTPLGSFTGQEGLISSSTLKEEGFPDFEFLCHENNPSFSLNLAAIEIFRSHSHYDDLLALKTKLVNLNDNNSSSKIIITGQSMGGCVAALFTLWLLEDIKVLKTGPLCFTFGSPLIGDEHLRKRLEFSIWESHFLHVASHQDRILGVVILSQEKSAYRPFGAFLLFSGSSCAVSEDPVFVLEQLLTTNSPKPPTLDTDLLFDYGKSLEDFKRKACDTIEFNESKAETLQSSIMTQLNAIEALSQPSTEIDDLIKRMSRHEAKSSLMEKRDSDSDRVLHQVKIRMAFLEWYKKDSKMKNLGYYDQYRNQGNTSDIIVNEYKKKVMNSWEDAVTEVESRPPLEGAPFKLRWLYAGNNYRRMVEPLHISDYYRDGGKNYVGERPRHFKLLEEWLQKQRENKKKQMELEEKKRKEQKEKHGMPEEKPEPKTSPDKAKKMKVNTNLTEDSCFWARVEEALLLLKNKDLTTEDKVNELKIFEDYVWNALKNYEVSPEIFLDKSSFMKWWEAYRGEAQNSSLKDFMNNRLWVDYAAGTFI